MVNFEQVDVGWVTSFVFPMQTQWANTCSKLHVIHGINMLNIVLNVFKVCNKDARTRSLSIGSGVFTQLTFTYSESTIESL